VRRPRPSLVRLITFGFILANAVAVLLLLLALYPLFLVEDEEPVAPEVLITLVGYGLSASAEGAPLLAPTEELRRFVEANPGSWFLIQGPGGVISRGQVPTEIEEAARRFGPSLYQGRYRNVGAKGPEGEVVTDEFEVGGRNLVVTGGGVSLGAITYGQYLSYMWGNYFFWLPLFTAIFNVAGALITIPIILRSLRPTAVAAAKLNPADLSERLPEREVVKELRPIVRAFNAALDRLAEGFERRRRFIADVAHELRTPLAILNMHVEVLPDGGRKPDLQRTVYRLGQMIGQMLDAERLVLAARKREPVDLVALARAAIADIAPLAVANGYELAFKSEAESMVVDGDMHALSRAIANLLGNAVAHGGGYGTIEVHVHADGQVDVSDQGEGVPIEARERIFEPFHRERWDKDGCGLGLHLVREIMQAHGGHARLLSSGPGAVFRLEFPAPHTA
jgi:signal transduction histidine kinase